MNGNAPASEGAGTTTTTATTAAAAFQHEEVMAMAGLACVVKLYDFREGHVKLNDTAEFVGVLGYDQSPPIQEDTPTEGSSNPFQGLEDFSPKVPPPSLAPRLHCICETFPDGLCAAVTQERILLYTVFFFKSSDGSVK